MRGPGTTAAPDYVVAGRRFHPGFGRPVEDGRLRQTRRTSGQLRQRQFREAGGRWAIRVRGRKRSGTCQAREQDQRRGPAVCPSHGERDRRRRGRPGIDLSGGWSSHRQYPMGERRRSPAPKPPAEGVSERHPPGPERRKVFRCRTVHVRSCQRRRKNGGELITRFRAGPARDRPFRLSKVSAARPALQRSLHRDPRRSAHRNSLDQRRFFQSAAGRSQRSSGHGDPLFVHSGVRIRLSGTKGQLFLRRGKQSGQRQPCRHNVPPRWRIEPSDSSATRGRPAVVDCQADGFPVPRIRWTKAEGESPGEFRPISSSSRLHVFENGSLVVHSVQPEDAGHYLCQASNGVGQGLSKVVRVSVHVAAHFESKFRAESVRKGEDARLVCEAIGDRPMHVTWLKDKQAFEPQSDMRYDLTETVLGGGTTSSLTIRRADRRDSALYTCIAANAFGKDDTNIQLIMQEPPDSPQDAKVLEFASRSAKIGWTAPYSGNSPIQQYIVHYKEEADRWQQQSRNLTTAGSETNVNVRGLQPITFYHFRVYAENALGRSEPSNVIHLRTEQEAPGGPPQKVKARATGAHTIKVAWKPPRKDLQYGLIEGFYVGYRESGSKEAFIYKTLRAKGSDGNAVLEETQLSGLKRLTEYVVIVQAYNAKGASPPSDQVLVKTLENDPPGSPSVRVTFSNHTSIGLAWEQTDIENSVQGFIVHHKWELGDWQEMELPASETNYSLHDLKCGSRYQFYVSAFNIVGRGIPSDVIRTKTEGRAPVAPDKQSLISANQTYASVHLGTWLDGGCPINTFAVRYRQQRQQQWVSAAVTGQMVTLEDLIPATWYRLQVTAHNEAGSTDAEYTFVTSPLHYMPDDILPSLPSPDDVLPLYLDVNILVPAAVSFAVVVALVALVCVIVHKRPRYHDTSQTGSSIDPYGSSRKCGVHSESVPLSEKSSLKKALSDPRSGGYYPTPYATTRISAEEQQQQKEAAARQALEEPLYATVKRTPRPPRSDFHVYHYPGEMPDFFLQTTGKELDELGASSSSVFWKESPDTKLKDEYRSEMLQDCSHSGGQRKSHRYSQR